MKKIFTIGEFSLDIIFDAKGLPIGTMAGGREVNAAMIAARAGRQVEMIGELSADSVGDIIMEQLEAAGVDVSAVDRFTEGETPTQLYVGDARSIRYENYPDSCFDVIWPRIENGDVVVFGGYYALDERMRPRMTQLLNHAHSRGAVLVYVPGFDSQRCPRVTRVMPAVLENLEMSDLVVMTEGDCAFLFGVSSGEQCYRDHVDFYCRSMVNINAEAGRLEYFSADTKSCVELDEDVARSLIGQSGVIAGVAEAISVNNIKLDYQTVAGDEVRGAILSVASRLATESYNNLSQPWQKQY